MPHTLWCHTDSHPPPLAHASYRKAAPVTDSLCWALKPGYPLGAAVASVEERMGLLERFWLT
jgi:hypothetical protein